MTWFFRIFLLYKSWLFLKENQCSWCSGVSCLLEPFRVFSLTAVNCRNRRPQRRRWVWPPVAPTVDPIEKNFLGGFIMNTERISEFGIQSQGDLVEIWTLLRLIGTWLIKLSRIWQRALMSNLGVHWKWTWKLIDWSGSYWCLDLCPIWVCIGNENGNEIVDWYENVRK